MAAYKELYKYCQELKPKVSTKAIKIKALEITKAADVKTVKDSLDSQKLRGYFLSASNKESSLVRSYGCNVVVLARDMNECWDRFIFTKELMHLFDEQSEATSSHEQFKALLNEFEALDPSKENSPQFESDIHGFWMALACLCPEKSRQEFVDQFNKGHIDHYGIALKLKIPEQHVRQLFRPNYTDIIDSLLT